MIVARISKIIISCENDAKYKNKLLEFINIQIEIIKKNNNIKEKKNEFDGWIK